METVPVPRPWSIYVLCDPREPDPIRRVRYVGASVSPKGRCAMGVGNKRKREWICELREANTGPVQEIVETGDGDWQASERRWIRHFKQCGADLLNGKHGGFSKRGKWPPSPDYLPTMWRVRKLLDVLLTSARERSAGEPLPNKLGMIGCLFAWMEERREVRVSFGRLRSLYLKPAACWPVPLPTPKEAAAIIAAVSCLTPISPKQLSYYLAGAQSDAKRKSVEATLDHFIRHEG